MNLLNINLKTQGIMTGSFNNDNKDNISILLILSIILMFILLNK